MFSTLKSEFVRANGTASEVFKALAEEVHNINGTDDDLRQLLRDRALVQQIARLIVPRERLAYPVTVPAGFNFQSLALAEGLRPNEVLIRQMRHLEEMDEYCLQHDWDRLKPTDQPLAVELHMMTLDRTMPHVELLARLADADWRSADMVETLRFAVEWPQQQEQQSIVAPDCSGGKNEWMMVLNRGRMVEYTTVSREWQQGWRLLVAPASTSSLIHKYHNKMK